MIEVSRTPQQQGRKVSAVLRDKQAKALPWRHVIYIFKVCLGRENVMTPRFAGTDSSLDHLAWIPVSYTATYNSLCVDKQDVFFWEQKGAQRFQNGLRKTFSLQHIYEESCHEFFEHSLLNFPLSFLRRGTDWEMNYEYNVKCCTKESVARLFWTILWTTYHLSSLVLTNPTARHRVCWVNPNTDAIVGAQYGGIHPSNESTGRDPGQRWWEVATRTVRRV